MRVPGIGSRIRRAIRPDPPLAGSTHALWSVITSPAGFYEKQTAEIIDLALSAARSANRFDLSEVAERCSPRSADWVRSWPGEHYRLLAALVRETQPRTVVEIGTFLGESALALAAGDPDTQVITYDLVPWHEFDGTNLADGDFAPAGRIEQRIGDLADPAYLSTQRSTLHDADLLFIDGPKDGEWEKRVIPDLLAELRDRRRIVVFDDIRFLEMAQFWHDLDYPKVDLTSFGHWSGTGLVWTC